MRSAFIEGCSGLIAEDDSYLLFLSRIHPKKGVDLLLESYLSLYGEISHKGIKMPKLVIAGPGIETDFGKLIKKLAADSPYSDSVLFPDMLSGDAKWGAFYGCEAFVLPSHQENFGIAVAEALACAKPVLISDQVNIWREIEAEGGALIAPDTLPGTKTLLEQWLNMDPDNKKLMGEKALQAFLKNFGIHSAAKHFYKALNS
jgi:glycosyltransferase involved in cell wall biosynthesis